MPFGSHDEEAKGKDSFDYWYKIYTDIIEKYVKLASRVLKRNIRCIRLDDVIGSRLIDKTLMKYLDKEDICISDLTTSNPNVNYELGVRDAWSNNTIIITQNINDISFDKMRNNALLYSTTDRKMNKKFRKKFLEDIQDMIENPNEIRNTAQEYLQSSNTSKNIKGTKRGMWDISEEGLDIIRSSMIRYNSLLPTSVSQNKYTFRISMLSRHTISLPLEISKLHSNLDIIFSALKVVKRDHIIFKAVRKQYSDGVTFCYDSKESSIYFDFDTKGLFNCIILRDKLIDGNKSYINEKIVSRNLFEALALGTKYLNLIADASYANAVVKLENILDTYISFVEPSGPYRKYPDLIFKNDMSDGVEYKNNRLGFYGGNEIKSIHKGFMCKLGNIYNISENIDKFSENSFKSATESFAMVEPKSKALN